MALPQNINEQLNRVPTRTPGISGRILMMASMIFAISFDSYLGLEYGYKPYLTGQLDSLSKDIENFAKQIPPSEQIEIVNFYSQLSNLETLLSNHALPSLFFEWFEKNTQVNIFYQNFRFDITKSEIVLTGNARSIEDISEQLLILNQLPEVKKITLTNVSANPNKLWQFNLKVSINPKLIFHPSLSENQE